MTLATAEQQTDPDQNNSTGTSSDDDDDDEMSVEGGFSIDWSSDDIVQLLETHYGYLFQQNDMSATDGDNKSLLHADPSRFEIFCKEPPRGMENQSIQITLVDRSQQEQQAENESNNKDVKSNQKKFMLRVYGDSNKTREFIAFELDTMYKLRQSLSFPVPRIFETTKFLYSRQDIRDCIVDFKGHFAVMFEFCEGVHMTGKNKKNSDYIRAVAQFSGFLHKMTRQHEGFDPTTAHNNTSGTSGESSTSLADQPPYLLIDERFQVHVGRAQAERLTFEYFWEELNEIFECYMVKESETGKYVPSPQLDDQTKNMTQSMYDLCHGFLKHLTVDEQDVIERKIPRSLVHADAHTSNVLFITNDDGKPTISAVLDWDDCFIGASVIDLVQCMFFWCIRPSDNSSDDLSRVINLEFLRVYVSSYVEARGFPLTELERSYLFDYLYLLLFAQIHFLLSQNDVLAPCKESDMDEDYQCGRNMLGFFLKTGQQFNHPDFRNVFI